MPVSDETMHHVLNIVLRHADPSTARRILDDLKDVAGDKYFRDLVERMGDDVKVIGSWRTRRGVEK
jgi:hypothetical protein